MSKSNSVVVIGVGLAVLFSALELIKLDLKPKIFKRGKNERERTRDLAALNNNHIVNLEPNYFYGKGGSGTYSDGKLYTQSKKIGRIKKWLFN